MKPVLRSGDFYQQVFGFRDSETKKTRDHVSRHMTDGQIDFTLMKYDCLLYTSDAADE